VTEIPENLMLQGSKDTQSCEEVGRQTLSLCIPQGTMDAEETKASSDTIPRPKESGQ